jgi:inner membrane protein
MDSITQAVLGASIAAAAAPPGDRRKALLAGAVLGTLPDLDVLIDFGGAVENFTSHRGFSHSLFVLIPVSMILWLVLRRFWRPVREAPLRWLTAISLVLVTHPLLDAHTAYGTQLLWPLEAAPAMWATVFIIDPLFTLPILVATIACALCPRRAWGTGFLRSALAASCLYLGWSWTGKAIVNHHTREFLAEVDLADAPVFITPTPFNTLLWRIVVVTDSGYLEGLDSLVLNEGTIEFQWYPSDWKALDEAGDIEAVRRLRWFSRDFIRTEVRADKLYLSDLRMGQTPSFVFTHVVARREGQQWNEVPSELVPPQLDGRKLLASLQRIWSH